jgi:hypothetical protein
LPDTAKENPDHAVPILERRALSSSAEHLELMAEGNVFEDQRFAGAERSSDQMYDEI